MDTMLVSASVQVEESLPPPKSPSSSTSGSRSRSGSPPSQRRSVNSPKAPPSSEEGPGDDAAAAAAEDVLFMFFSYANGPIAHCLYAVVVSDDAVAFSKDKKSRAQVMTEQPSPLYPILEFPSGDYPSRMSCVELDSKLYFLGGQFFPRPTEKREHLNVFSPDVYVLDCASVTAAIGTAVKSAAASSNNSPSELLKVGTQMNTGKPVPYYVFVAYRRIYVILGHSPLQKGLSRFEFFDPDTNQWSILPDPPMNSTVGGHAVVDRKIFMVTADMNVFCFNVDNCEWGSFLTYNVPPRFTGRAEFVEDTLYASYYNTIAAFGSTEPVTEAIKGLFDHVAILTPELDDVLIHLPTTEPSSFLVHLGNRIFCYVFAGPLRDPNHPDEIFVSDTKRLGISLTVFRALKDTYSKSYGADEITYFRAEFLRSAHFVATSIRGARAGKAILYDCFSAPCSAGTRKGESKIKG